LNEIGWKVVDKILVAEDCEKRRAVVSTIMNLRVLLKD